MSYPVNEGERVIMLRPATTINFETGEHGSVWQLDVMNDGKGLSERNRQFTGSFKTPEDACEWLAAWFKAGCPE